MIKTAAIVAVGDEVLAGDVVNSNGSDVAQILLKHGVSPRFHMVVGDKTQDIRQALQSALSSVDLVVMVGGLGPTPDDRTKEAVAQFLGSPLIRDPELFQSIADRHGRQAGWQESVNKQSEVIQGARIWANSAGTAPGQLIMFRAQWIVLLPGPPRELAAVVEDHLEPWLDGVQPNRRIARETLVCFDAGESVVASYLTPLLQGQHPRIGTYSRPGRIEIRLEAPIGERREGLVSLRRAESWLKAQFPGKLYRLGGHSREAFLIRTMVARGWRVGVMESLTGGVLLSRLVDVPGASGCVTGGAVAYSDSAKIQMGVPPEILEQYTAVSAESAQSMAEAVRRFYGTEVGIATTGYAGPDGGTYEDPVGTFYVGVAVEARTEVRRRQVHSHRSGVRSVAVETAFSLVWDMLELPLDLTI